MIYHLRSAAHLEESPVVMAFRKKMASEEARKQYRRRGRIVEFCHAWIKSSLRQFHVRGLKKSADGNAVACLTYNLQHWIRLSKLHTTTAIARDSNRRASRTETLVRNRRPTIRKANPKFSVQLSIEVSSQLQSILTCTPSTRTYR